MTESDPKLETHRAVSRLLGMEINSAGLWWVELLVSICDFDGELMAIDPCRYVSRRPVRWNYSCYYASSGTYTSTGFNVPLGYIGVETGLDRGSIE